MGDEDELARMAAQAAAALTGQISESCARALEAGMEGSWAGTVAMCELMISSGPAPKHEAGYRLVKSAVLREAGMYGPALEEADRAVALEPDAASLVARADVLQASGDHEEAVGSYERAEKRARGEELAGIILRKLKSLEILKRREECAAESCRALKASPGSPTALAYKVGNLRAVGRGAESVRLAKETLDRGENPVVGLHMAAMLYEEGSNEEGLDHVNAILKSLARSHDVWILKARLLARLGRTEAAIDAMTVAAGIDPEAAASAAAAKDDDLEPLRKDARFVRLFGGGR